VSKIHSDYLDLQYRNKFDLVLKEYKNNPDMILKLFNIIDDKKIDINALIPIIDLGNDIKKLTIEKEN
jgi:hypothetical protein